MIRWTTVIGFAVLTSLSAQTLADSWRCGRQIVKTGDTPAAVIQRCGRPDLIERGRESIRGGRSHRTSSTRHWTYLSSHNKRSKTLIFANGRLLRIEHRR